MDFLVFDACSLIALADNEDGADVIENYLADEIIYVAFIQ